MQSTMKLSGLVLALAVALPQVAVAAGQGNDRADDGPKTRAEVQQELREWQRNPVSHDGWMMRGDGTVYVGPSNDSQAAQASVSDDDGPKTRAEVRQELREWRRNPVSHDGWLTWGDAMLYVGTSNNLQDSRSASGAVSGDDDSKTRAEVRQELREWQRNPVSDDGWMMRGDGMVYVGVQDEPAKHSAGAVGADGSAGGGVGTGQRHTPALSQGAHC